MGVLRVPLGTKKRHPVLVYVAERRAVVGTYTAGTVFEYRSLAELKEGIDASEVARFGDTEIDEGWLEDVFEWQPHGWAIDVCQPRAITPQLKVDDALVKKAWGPTRFLSLDLGNPAHARLWSGVEAPGIL